MFVSVRCALATGIAKELYLFAFFKFVSDAQINTPTDLDGRIGFILLKEMAIV